MAPWGGAQRWGDAIARAACHSRARRPWRAAERGSHRCVRKEAVGPCRAGQGRAAAGTGYRGSRSVAGGALPRPRGGGDRSRGAEVEIGRRSVRRRRLTWGAGSSGSIAWSARSSRPISRSSSRPESALCTEPRPSLRRREGLLLRCASEPLDVDHVAIRVAGNGFRRIYTDLSTLTVWA